VTSIVSNRLRDLAALASQLADVVDAERPDQMLPQMAVCRLAILADETANKLAGMADSLQPVGSREARDLFGLR
jgi:hypothetical protein